jgi:hypothetical protein
MGLWLANKGRMLVNRGHHTALTNKIQLLVNLIEPK